jgi:hypothetical protein
VVVGEPGHPDQFPYIDCWQNAVLSQTTWLKSHLEKACRVMEARVAAASKYREKCKKQEKPTLAGGPQGDPTPSCATVPAAFCPFTSTLRRGSSIRRGSPSNNFTYKARPRSPWICNNPTFLRAP